MDYLVSRKKGDQKIKIQNSEHPGKLQHYHKQTPCFQLHTTDA